MDPVVIGLTGGIASGKSTIAKLLKRRGAVVIDADKEAKSIIRQGKPAWSKLINAFGEEILNADKSIDRRHLGNIVFGDQQLLAKLNSIVHPGVVEEIAMKIEHLQKGSWPAIVLDAPLLYEVGAEKLVDIVWVVCVSRETQINRLINRDNLTQDQAIQRIEAQMPVSEKKARADAVIDNMGTRRETRETVHALWQRYVEQNAVSEDDLKN